MSNSISISENGLVKSIVSIPRVEFIAPNQAIININSVGSFFQSYSSTIVYIDTTGKVFLDESSWDYSRTTSKYRNEFLNETTKETKKKIKRGEYLFTNLN